MFLHVVEDGGTAMARPRESESMTRHTFVDRAVIVLVALLTGTPVFAQIDLAGMWNSPHHQDWMQRDPGSNPVDYLALPLNDAGREKALLYNYSQTAQMAHQCAYYTPFYAVIGVSGLKIWPETDSVAGNKIVAWRMSGFNFDVITIWVDGRPHPPNTAFHPYSGFTTGVWQGDVLVTYTTHMKAGFIRRNGAPSSDRATMRQFIVRHGDLLTITSMLEDPVYLTEPYVVSRSFQLDPRANIRTTQGACEPISEVPDLDLTGVVPRHLPGRNPFVNELSQIYNIPVEAVLGGADTMYPEYRKSLRDAYVRPEKCVRYCGQNAPGLHMITDGTGRPQP
jgi:hypothetical protein